jgi:4-hydroxythreonine-4-phosphate dehydrogenase
MGKIDAMITAPINKEAMGRAGYSYPGHTEFLAKLTRVKNPIMMLAGDNLKVALVTTHCPLKKIPDLITFQKILTTIEIVHSSLKQYFGLDSPKIAVAALNPHGGEGGLFGDEEKKIILPAIKEALNLGIDVEGPFPSDSLFYHAAKGKYHLVICMYHDQGLIPLKLLNFHNAVNVTLGLPIIRISPDHGTAYDIAGKGIANPSSMLKALELAARMARINSHSPGD